MQTFSFSPLQKTIILSVTVVAAAAVGYLNFLHPPLQVAPLAVILVLIISVLAGSRWGYAAAIVFALGLALERADSYRLPANTAVFNIALLAVVNVGAVALVSLIRNTGLAEAARRRSELEAAEARYRAIGESMPYGVWESKGDRLRFASDSFLNLAGCTLEEIKSGTWLERVPADDARRFLERWNARDAGDDTFECEYRIRGQDANYQSILSRGVRVYRDGKPTNEWVGLSLDITERKRAEESLRFLAEAGRVLSGSLEPREVLDRIANLVVPRLADDCSIEMIENDDVKPSPSPDVRSTRTDSAITVPMLARNRTFGALTLRCSPSGRRFDALDLELAEHLGRRAGLAYDNALHYAREHRVAETLQRAALPAQLPVVPGLSLAAAYVSGATGLEVGGDWYDAMPLPDGNVALSVGDVAGKGLRAAAAMSAIRQVQRASAIERLSPAEVLDRTNRILLAEQGEMTTCVFGIFDLLARTFTFANAGHPSPIVGYRDGTATALDGRGVPMGIFSGAVFPQSTVEIPEGSLLVLLTDGLLEHDRDVVRGELGVLAAIGEEAKEPSADPAAGITKRVLSKPPSDDIAVIVVSVPEVADALNVVMPTAPSNLRVLRQSLRRFANFAGLDPGQVSLLLIAVGEALNNAVEHAYGTREGIVELRAWKKDDDRVVIEVGDKGTWRPPSSERHSRGLGIMRALIETVAVNTSSEGTTVRFEVPLTGEQDRERPGELSHT